MGIFGPAIGDEKREDGKRYAYGWCPHCLGMKYTIVTDFATDPNKPIFKVNNNPKMECQICKGKGKYWHGPIDENVSLDKLCVDDFGFLTLRVPVFDKKTPTETAFRAPAGNSNSTYSSSSSSTCHHSWYRCNDPVTGEYKGYSRCRKCNEKFY